jgi:catechol 2,3-dioxygenase-like lactoylglutathione lyase family enzyme
VQKTTAKSGANQATPPGSSILETCLYVEDLARACEFYTTLFGYPVLESDERFCALNVAGSQVLILFVRGSNPQGTMLSHGTIPPHDGSGPSHIGFKVPADGLAAWQSRLLEKGIPVESVVTWPKGGTSIYFRDPDGHLVELVTPGTWAVY